MPAHVTSVTVSMSSERPKTSVRPKTTRGGRYRGSVESLSSSQDEPQFEKTNSSSQEDPEPAQNNEDKEKRLLNRSRAQTAPTHSKYHSSCSLSSSSTDSLGSSGTGSMLRAKSVDGHPTPDTIHISCRVSNDKPGYYEFLRPYSAYTTPLWKPPKLPEGFRDSKKLNHSSLTEGERFYLWRTARVYGMTNMRKQNQIRYEKLLRHTVETGFHTEKDVQKYMNYFNGTRKRQFETDPTVWRAPPRIPVRPLHFRKPPTSPRGWNSYSPQGSLGKGRSDKANSSFPNGDKDGKAVDKKKTDKPKADKNKKDQPQKDQPQKDQPQKDQPKQDKSLLEEIQKDEPASQEREENNQKKEEKTDSAKATDPKSEKQTGPKIYYDMKLRRTVVKKESGNDADKENNSTSKTGSSKGNKNSKVSWKDQRKSKTAGPQRPPKARVSWEDSENSPQDSTRPKTSRGRMERVKSAKQRGKPEEGAEDQERLTPDSRPNSSRTQSSMSTSSSGSSSSGTSSSGTSSSSSGSGSSFSSSSPGSSRSNSTMKGNENDKDDDEARATLAKSFWNKDGKDENGEEESKQETASTSTEGSQSSNQGSNKVEYLYSTYNEDHETNKSGSAKGERSNSEKDAGTSSPGSDKKGKKGGRNKSKSSPSSVKGQQASKDQIGERSNKEEAPAPKLSTSSPRSTKSSRASSKSGTSRSSGTSTSSSGSNSSSGSGSSSGSSRTGSARSSSRSSVKGQEGESSQDKETSQSVISDDEGDDNRAKLAQSFWDQKL